MARPLTRRQLDRFAKTLEPGTRRAFLEAVEDIKAGAQMELLTELVREGNVDAIMFALGINPARFSPLAEAVRTSFLRAGMNAAAEVPILRTWQPYSLWRPSEGVSVRWSFDVTNPEAERVVREQSSRLITNIVQAQRESIRITLAEGVAVGNGPRSTALNIVGRIEGGRRQGGVIGLSAPQTQAVINARAELSDPNRALNFLSRQRRDKRFDAMIRKSAQSGKPLTPAQIDRIIGRYEDRLLQLRGEVIARTETISSMNAAREESYRQAIEAGGLLPENVVGTWQSGGDARTRDTHAQLHGQERHFGEPFESESGARMMYPGDVSLGAPAEETINCRCMKVFRIDHVAEANRAAA